MKLKKLKSIADKDSVSLSLSQDTGIVSVSFKYLGCSMGAQYSVGCEGIYAFTIDGPDKFFDAIDSAELCAISSALNVERGIVAESGDAD